jgi:glycosyltransferase involved in cell wall biosynthesis
LSGNELLSHYSAAHLFVLPSIAIKDGWAETQGVVLQEAQSSGIPVIASRTGGIPEVIRNRETGLLFDAENVQQLAEKIISLIADKELYKSLSTQARREVEENFSMEVICTRLFRIYRGLVKTSDGV